MSSGTDDISLEVDAGKLAEDILKHASESKNEEDLKMRVEHTLRPILDRWGVDWASYEHQKRKLSGKREDALYGHVILEYKTPGLLAVRSEFVKSKEQVKDYIKSEAAKDGLSKYLGIILDGYSISFVRFRKDEWDEQSEPLPINAQTVLRSLSAIRSLRRKPLDAEFLLVLAYRLWPKK